VLKLLFDPVSDTTVSEMYNEADETTVIPLHNDVISPSRVQKKNESLVHEQYHHIASNSVTPQPQILYYDGDMIHEHPAAKRQRSASVMAMNYSSPVTPKLQEPIPEQPSSSERGMKKLSAFPILNSFKQPQVSLQRAQAASTKPIVFQEQVDSATRFQQSIEKYRFTPHNNSTRSTPIRSSAKVIGSKRKRRW